MADKEITLKVAEAISQKDVGQGVARLDPNVMDDLGINERDLIEIVGERRTAAIALPSQTDIGLGVIRIDGLVRKNSGATIGGEVTIKKTKATEAKKVVLAPIENNIRVQGDVRGLFAGKVMVQGCSSLHQSERHRHCRSKHRSATARNPSGRKQNRRCRKPC